MSRLLVIVFALSCGPAPVEPDYFTARPGEPCPSDADYSEGRGRVACDVDRPRCTLYCYAADGVWVTDRCQGGCGGLSVSVPE